MKNAVHILITVIALVCLAACGARSDETTPAMAQTMLKLKGYHFNETEYFKALKLGDGIAVKGFLQGGIDPNAKNQDGETALTYAVQNNEMPIIRLLVEYSDINLRDGLGNSPLHLSLKKKKPEIFELLLEQNADVNVPGQAGSKITDQTVLLLAVSRNERLLVGELLDRGANPNIPDSSGSLALVQSVIGYDLDPEIVRMLLEKGADVNRIDGENGAPALNVVARNNQASPETRETIVKMLLDKGADRTIKDKDGKTAFAWARERKNTEILELLKQ